MSAIQTNLLLETISSEEELAAIAIELCAGHFSRLSESETSLIRGLPKPPSRLVARFRNMIHAGEDPLGDAFCSLRSAAERRGRGATYTPPSVVSSMMNWARRNASPARVIDPGAGSGRFVTAAGRMFKDATLVAVEIDPLAALITRAHLAEAGLAPRATVLVEDYRSSNFPAVDGQTLFVGNPPYVRHHVIEEHWKRWLTETAARYGHSASQLAGLHVHFFLATLTHAKPGDIGVFITAGEWLDVNYGKLVRDLFRGGLGGKSLHILEPTALPFPDAATTAVISCFEVGAQPSGISFKRIETADAVDLMDEGPAVERDRLQAVQRWTPFTRLERKVPAGFIELGEICQVHRGQVTGANRIWIAGPHSQELPASLSFPSITRGKELFSAGLELVDAAQLRRVIDLPDRLDVLSSEERRIVEQFLIKAKQMGADRGFIAEHRKAWWSVGLRDPAPILATYMARRSPAFVLNLVHARHINIAHGLYPRQPLTDVAMRKLVEYLAACTSVADGRTYAGGLTKFEPKEMERLPIPDLAMLEEAI